MFVLFSPPPLPSPPVLSLVLLFLSFSFFFFLSMQTARMWSKFSTRPLPTASSTKKTRPTLWTKCSDYLKRYTRKQKNSEARTEAHERQRFFLKKKKLKRKKEEVTLRSKCPPFRSPTTVRQQHLGDDGAKAAAADGAADDDKTDWTRSLLYVCIHLVYGIIICMTCLTWRTRNIPRLIDRLKMNEREGSPSEATPESSKEQNRPRSAIKSDEHRRCRTKPPFLSFIHLFWNGCERRSTISQSLKHYTTLLCSTVTACGMLAPAAGQTSCSGASLSNT